MRLVDRDGEAFRAASSAPGGEAPEEARLALGQETMVRFLKRGGYGQYDLWTAGFRRESGAVVEIGDGPARWDSERFAERCAGCHATAAEEVTGAVSAPALDCYTCHGNVDIDHPAEPSLALFATSRADEARVVISICASCHLRGGRSRSTGRPYPNQFVPSDNLFRDYQVDLSLPAIARLPPSDRHVFENVRAVAVEGRDAVTCLTCHAVHDNRSDRHRQLRPGPSCGTCHSAPEDLSRVVETRRSSAVCEY